jgi:hypothetical protein
MKALYNNRNNMMNAYYRDLIVKQAERKTECLGNKNLT